MTIETPKDLSLKDFFENLENELKPYEKLDIEFQLLNTLQNAAAARVFKKLKVMLLPEALSSVKLSAEQFGMVRSSLFSAFQIEQAGYGGYNRYRVTAFHTHTILAIAAYLNSMIPHSPVADSYPLGQLDLWPRVAETLEGND